MMEYDDKIPPLWFIFLEGIDPTFQMFSALFL